MPPARHGLQRVGHTALLLAALFADVVSHVGDHETPMQVLDRLLAGYDRRLRPEEHAAAVAHGPEDGTCKQPEPTRVNTTFYIEALNNIDQKDQTMRIDGYLRLTWRDERLQYNTSTECYRDTIPIASPQLIWYPEVYFLKALETVFATETSRDQNSRTFALNLHPDGRLTFSQRISITQKCPMNFHSLPFDVQHCQIEYGPYALSTRQLVIQWSGPDTNVGNWNQQSGPWAITAKAVHEVETLYSSGNYSTVAAIFRFERGWEPYLNDIIEACTLVFMTYMGFYVDQGSVPARTSLSFLGSLMLMTAQDSLKATMPVLDYTPWLVYVLQGAFYFNLFAFFEYALVQCGMRAKRKLLAPQTAPPPEANRIPPIRSFDCMDNSLTVQREFSGPQASTDSLTPPSLTHLMIPVDVPAPVSRHSVGSATDALVQGTINNIKQTQIAAGKRKEKVDGVYKCRSVRQYLAMLNDLDLLMRWVYPAAFGLYLICMWSLIPESPDMPGPRTNVHYESA